MDPKFLGGLCALLIIVIGMVAVPWLIGQRHADRMDAARPVRRRLPDGVADLGARRSKKRPPASA